MPSVGRFRGIALLLVLAAAGAPARAELCRNRKGILLLRPGDCRKKETQVDPGSLPLAGDRGDKGPTGDPGPDAIGPRLHVVDSAGRDVGIDVGAEPGALPDGATTVLRQIGRDLFVFGVDASGFVANEELLGYASADCAKPATSVLVGDSYTCECSPSLIDVTGLALPLFVDQEKTMGYRLVAAVGGGVYMRGVVYGSTADDATEACSAQSGTLLGAPAPCASDASRVCVSCCLYDVNAFHVRQAVEPVDLASLGLVPPFAFRTLAQ